MQINRTYAFDNISLSGFLVSIPFTWKTKIVFVRALKFALQAFFSKQNTQLSDDTYQIFQSIPWCFIIFIQINAEQAFRYLVSDTEGGSYIIFTLSCGNKFDNITPIPELTCDRNNWRSIVKRVVQYKLRVTS